MAVVTGAAGGIGRGLAGGLIDRSCRVALVDVDARKLGETARDLRAKGGVVSEHEVDVADRCAMAELPQEVVDTHGAVHLLFNNAGVSAASPFERSDLDDFEWVMGVNFWGVVYGCRYFLPHLSDGGHIVNILSDFALLGFPTKTAYCASKFGVRGFGEALQSELHGQQISVTNVYPGPVDTGLIRSGRHWDPRKQEEEARFVASRALSLPRVVRRILAAVERDRARVRIGKETLAIDLMKRFFPSLTDSLLSRFRHRVPFASEGE